MRAAAAPWLRTAASDLGRALGVDTACPPPPSPRLLQHLLVVWPLSQERCVATPPNWEGALVTSSFEL